MAEPGTRDSREQQRSGNAVLAKRYELFATRTSTLHVARCTSFNCLVEGRGEGAGPITACQTFLASLLVIAL